MAEYKIKAQKSVFFLYTNDKHTEKEISEIIPFFKKTAINLSKVMKILYNENIKTLKKEIQEDARSGKNNW